MFDLPLWSWVVLLLLLTFYIYTARKHSLFRRYGMPYSKPYPFIGCFPQLVSKGVMQCEYEETLQLGKCFGFFLGNLPTVLLTDPDIIKEIFIKRFNSFHNRSQAAGASSFWERTILMTTNLDNWKFLRTTLTPTFTSGKLKKMESLMLKCIERNITKIKAQLQYSNEEIDMAPVFKDLTLETICQAAMGVHIDSESKATLELKKHISKMLDLGLEKNKVLLALFLIPDLKKIIHILDIDYNDTEAIAYVQECMVRIIKERQMDNSKMKKDLLQLMINTNEESKRLQCDESNANNESSEKQVHTHRGMHEDEIIANAMMFLFAGYDTTSTALIFTTYFLATQPEYQMVLVKEIEEQIGKSEPTYENIQSLQNLDMFISETMRLYPPVTRANRQIQEDTIIGKYTFPKNVSVTVPIFTLHRLQEFWPDPEQFRPERFSSTNKANILPYTYMPFGVGPRNCLGMRFANMELKMTIVKMLQNFSFKPSPRLHIPPKLEKHVFCKPVGGMKLIVKKRVAN